MAILTRELGRCFDNGTAAVLTIDYDDVALRLTAIHIVNQTSLAVFATARRVNGTGQVYTVNVPAGQTFDQTIGAGAQNRLDITITPNGRVDGVDYTFGFGTA